MAGPLRLTMFFDDGIYGWSESHYDTLSQTLEAAVQRCVSFLVPQRMALMAAGPWLKYIRASYDNVFRDSQVFFTPTPPTNNAGQYANNSQWKQTSASAPWTVALLRGVGGDLYRKSIYVSGVVYVDPTDIGQPTQDPFLVQAFQNYQKVLINGYGFPVWLRDLATFPPHVITAMVPNATANTVTLTVPNHNIPNPPGPGTRVFLSKMRYFAAGKVKVNGPFPIVNVPDANTVVITNLNLPAGFLFLSGFCQYNVRG